MTQNNSSVNHHFMSYRYGIHQVLKRIKNLWYMQLYVVLAVIKSTAKLLNDELRWLDTEQNRIVCF